MNCLWQQLKHSILFFLLPAPPGIPPVEGKKSAEKLRRKIRDCFHSKLFKSFFILFLVCLVAIWVNEYEPKFNKDLIRFLFSNAEPIALSSAAIIFLLESSDRQKRELYEAWQVINTAKDRAGSAGRIEALEHLCSEGVDLAGIEVSEAYLPRIDLKYGKLRSANFKKANLEQANFKGAELHFANLEGAILKEADLRWATLAGAELRGANLFRVNLEGQFLWGLLCSHASLIEANLRKANLNHADLRGANLRNTDLTEASLYNANIEGADLRGAFLCGTKMEGANLKDANLEGANLSGANLAEVKNLTKDQLSKAIIYQTTLPENIELCSGEDFEFDI